MTSPGWRTALVLGGAGSGRSDYAATLLSGTDGPRRVQAAAGDDLAALAQLAVAWVLQNPNVSSAIIGASRPEQLEETVKASGITLDAGLLKAIDEALEPVIERDPARTQSVTTRP